MNRDDARAIGWLTILGIGLLVVGLVVAGMAVLGVGFFKKSTADFRGGVAATEQVQANGAYRIAAYDHFFDLCAQIQGKESQLAALRTEQASATGQRAEIVAATITGVSAARGTQIAQYNADASKAGTLAQFQSSALPFTINPAQETTTCAR